MRRFLVGAAAALITATLAVGTVAGAGQLWKAPPFSSIGIYTAVLDPNKDYREEGSALGALSIFVETGSSSNACLATLNEAWHDSGWAPGYPNPQTLYCASRSPLIDGVVRHGVGVTIVFTDVVREDLNLQVNVYQEGAKYYNAPVPCEQQWCGG